MSYEIRYCYEDEDVSHVAENMDEQQIRRLPVMSRDQRLVGIVSLSGISRGSLPHTARELHGISKPGGHIIRATPSRPARPILAGGAKPPASAI